MDVLLVAEEAAGLQALRLVIAEGHWVVGVLSASPPGRGATVASEAERVGLPVLDPVLVKDPEYGARVSAQGVDLLLNVHSLQVACPEVVDAPGIGSFNLHPGPLPEYAGLNVPSWAIYNGETRHGVSLHWMEPEVDAGPLAYSADLEIDPADTGLSLSAKCVRAGLPLVERLLRDAAAGAVPRVEQDLRRRRFYGAEPPHGGRLPWSLPACRLVDLVRAADYSPLPSPWGHPRATLGGQELEIVRVAATGQPAAEPPGTIAPGARVASGDEWVVVEALRAGGQRADPAETLPPGWRFEPGGG